MIEVTEFIGIDISKDTFDYFGKETGTGKLPNNEEGFSELISQIDQSKCCVMEATGAYHHRLANFLYDHGIWVVVANPLSINRYIQMRLKRTKTDKGDAKLIAEYAEANEVHPWEPLPKYIEDCRTCTSIVALMLKQRTQLMNKLHYISSKGNSSSEATEVIESMIEHLTENIEFLEASAARMINDHDPELLTCLKSIPGIGLKTAMTLVVHTNGMTGFESAKQMSSYFGLAPTERSSGSSVRGSSRISKRGNPKIRQLLFLCSFTASQVNPQCNALYERLLNKGKCKKLALIAVTNKLLKQALAISQSRIPYDPQYKSVKP